MRIGYPCINRSIGCTANSTFRLKNYSEENIIEKVQNNLDCLKKVLQFNIENNLLFFRISSDLVPFASHPVCKFDWAKHFQKDFKEIGKYVTKNKMRISMHPDQFVVINSPNKDVVKRSIAELQYHCKLLDAMKLDETAKVQIHVGGVYNDKSAAMIRFAETYSKLDKKITRRLVIENDDRSYSMKDCIELSKLIKIPILFDSFHHECLNNKESVKEAMASAEQKWKRKDGKLMVDYSSQKKGARKGTHTEHINLKNFEKFLLETRDFDFDIMLEIKDKEKSALKAVKLI